MLRIRSVLRFSQLKTHSLWPSINMCASTLEHNHYNIRPIKLGVEVQGISLQTDPPRAVIDQIKHDVHKYRMMVFKDQGLISGKRQVEISRWFGQLDSTFYCHPKSPDPDVFRVSNDESEGCTNVGRTGWHIDGSFQPAPFTYSIYHIIEVPRKGDTVFAPLNELISRLSEAKRSQWERLWMVSDRRNNIIHPLIYTHPVTKLKTLCFHLGMTEAFIWDRGEAGECITDWAETSQILDEIHEEFVRDGGSIQYPHQWKKGDFIISDNLAVGHEASEETQFPTEEVGLRVMHRTTVRGQISPRKSYTVD